MLLLVSLVLCNVLMYYKVQFLPFIHSCDSGLWQLLYSNNFNILVFYRFTYTCNIVFLHYQFYIMLIYNYLPLLSLRLSSLLLLSLFLLLLFYYSIITSIIITSIYNYSIITILLLLFNTTHRLSPSKAGNMERCPIRHHF